MRINKNGKKHYVYRWSWQAWYDPEDDLYFWWSKVGYGRWARF